MNKSNRLGGVVASQSGYKIRQVGSYNRAGIFEMKSYGIYAGKRLVKDGYKTKDLALEAVAGVHQDRNRKSERY